MKLTIDRTSLLKPLGHVQSIVERRSMIAILSNIVFEAKDGHLILTASDMEMDIVETVSASVHEQGVVTVPAQLLYDIVRKLPEGAEVEVETIEGDQIKISAGRSVFKLSTLPVDDFPAINTQAAGTEFVIAAVDLKSLIENTRFAVSTEETRYYLNGIYMHLADGQMLRAVSTDGHRLARSQMDMPAGADAMPSVIIPRKAVGEMSKLIDEFEGDITVNLTDTRAHFTFGSVHVTTKLIEGSFPDYQRVIPQENKQLMKIAVSSFKSSVDRVASIATDKTCSVKLSLAGNILTLSTNSKESSAVETLEVDYSGDDMDIGFNARYLMDVAEQIDGEMIEFALSDASAPAVIRAPEDDANLFVLMPMRV